MMKLLLMFLILLGCSFGSTISLLSVGNGQGWNDGSLYVGFAQLEIDGKTFDAVCIDPLHEANVGDQWSANLVPIQSTNTTLQEYFPGVILEDALPRSVWLYAAMDANRDKQQTVVQIQHAEWDLFGGSFKDGGWTNKASHADLSGLDVSRYLVVADETFTKQAFLVSGHATPTPEPSDATMICIGLLLLCCGGNHLASRE